MTTYLFIYYNFVDKYEYCGSRSHRVHWRRLDPGFKSFVEQYLVRKLNELLNSFRRGWLEEKLLYEILCSDVVLVFFVPPFHFFVLFFTPTRNAYRWKAVKGKLAELMMLVEPKLYRQHVRYNNEKGEAMLYVKMSIQRISQESWNK